MSAVAADTQDPGIEFSEGGIRIAREGTKVDPAVGTATVVVRSVDGNPAAIPVLRSQKASDLAVRFAVAKGISPATFTSTAQSPYPATRTGTPCRNPAERPDHYRVQFTFQRGGVM
jgi:hypothetical protein